MSNVKDLYKAHYEFYKECFTDERLKYSWAATEIFDIWTYDSSLDELFVKDILEVCKVILDQENFEYIKDEQNYKKYILVCQLLDKFHWIEWGTSIRGAWFDDDNYCPKFESRPIVKENEWWGPEWTADGEMERHTIAEVRFNEDNIKALIEFMTEDVEG